MTDAERKELEETNLLLDEIEARKSVALRFQWDTYTDQFGKVWKVFCIVRDLEAANRNLLHPDLAARDRQLLEQSRAEVFG